MTVLGVGDQNGDGVKDLVVREDRSGRLGLRAGRVSHGRYSLGARTSYGTETWTAARRPLLASAGNVQGRVVRASYRNPRTGATVAYRQFRPTAGAGLGDVWATTAADPAAKVTYRDAHGKPASRACPTGCLLFHPGGAKGPGLPLLAGSSGWATTVNGIF
ncbi:hypothetical protein [Streptomyces sp. NPDC089919]|uniref:hypothetical protein n=1 Tax=Streptomyces sp. NPDC089919 TaxID=3155188 RepID=UPI00342F4791